MTYITGGENIINLNKYFFLYNSPDTGVRSRIDKHNKIKIKYEKM